MTIICSICKHPISTKPEDAQKDVLEKMKDVVHKMTKHLLRHPDHHRELGLSIELFATYTLLQYCDIPETETDLIKVLEDVEKTLAEVLDLEVAPEATA
jgi:hypothetical protein